MSSRVLKKLQGGPEKDLFMRTGLDGDQQSDDEDEEETTGRMRHLNPFDLLNQQSFSESEVKEDDNETEHASAATNLPAGPAASKKKKRKRKKKTKHTGNHISSEDNELYDKHLNDIDSIIGKSCDVGAQNHHVPLPRIEIDKSLLCVETRNLNPQNEMRRTFGKRVVKIENKRGRNKHSLKTTYMVTPKDSWPPNIKNMIHMKPTPAPDIPSNAGAGFPALRNVQWFAFEHSQYYQSVQNTFLPAVERTDSDFIINLIRRCPYHIDALMQLSELCKMTEDYALASELIERALYVLESSLHPTFSLTSGNCRMDYRRQENRSFYLVLFKQAQYLESRACARTAFELSKFILSLSPEVDPLAIILVIDYYAIRSKQYDWVVKFYEEYDAVRNLSQLPNMAYSYALALYCTLGECEKSDKALQYALLMFPGVLCPLLNELSVQPDKRVLASSFFNSDVSSSQPPALHQLVCLYVCRAKVIWRINNNLSWMERNVNAVLDRVDAKDPIVAEYNQKRTNRYVAPPRAILRHVFLSDFKEKVPLADFLAQEHGGMLLFDPLPPLDSVNRYERKSSSSSPTAAGNNTISTFFQSLWPSWAEQAHAGAAAAGAAAEGGARAAGAEGAAGAGRPAAVGNAAVGHGGGRQAAAAARQAERRQAGVADDVNLELMRANRQLQELDFEAAHLDDFGVGAIGGGPDPSLPYRELTQSLTNIVDAMRDFLQNFRIGDSLQVADGEQDGSSEEDTTDYYD